MAENELIETLVANQGQNEGEAIGSYGRSIVFMPTGTPIGSKVRVRLIELEKRDRRGRAMYRAEPAPDEIISRWRDNGDGTAVLLSHSLDWLFVSGEDCVEETHVYEKRENVSATTTRSNYSIVWGDSRESSVIEDHQELVIPIEEERVVNGSLVWEQTSEMTRPRGPYYFPLVSVAVLPCAWRETQLYPSWHIATGLAVRIGGQSVSGTNVVYDHITMHGEMPQWWRDEQEAYYPVCLCGRARYNTGADDGFGKCDECRKERACDRCHKHDSAIHAFGLRMICDDCVPWEELEERISSNVPPEELGRVATEARNLLSGVVFGEEGANILKATTDHLSEGSIRANAIHRWSGYAHYYFCEDGVYGSKFSPAALQTLALLPHATGNGLVEMVAWLATHHQAQAQDYDYYYRSQILGEELDIHYSRTENAICELAQGELHAGIRLRGTESDRVAALVLYRDLQEKVAGLSEQREEAQAMRAVENILQDTKQDYTDALARLRKIESRLTERDRPVEIPDSVSGTGTTIAAAFAKAKRGEK